MANTEGRPGILLYFETFDALSEYEMSEIGEFVYSAVQYARYGAEPSFADRGLRGLWALTRRSIDRDTASYEEKIQKNRYASAVAALKRRSKEDGTEPIVPTFEEWLSADNESNQMNPSGTMRYHAVPSDTQLQPQLQLQPQHQPQPQRNPNTTDSGGVGEETAGELLDAYREARRMNDHVKMADCLRQLNARGADPNIGGNDANPV